MFHPFSPDFPAMSGSASQSLAAMRRRKFSEVKAPGSATQPLRRTSATCWKLWNTKFHHRFMNMPYDSKIQDD